MILSIFAALAGAFGLHLKTLTAMAELNKGMTTPAAGSVLSGRYDEGEKLTYHMTEVCGRD